MSEAAVVGNDPEDAPLDWLTAGPASELYAHMELSGEVERLRGIPQLGAVAWVMPRASHSRWKYMTRLMLFADKIAASDKLLGAYGLVPVGTMEYAGRDIIQCWAMLGNCGHLWGTFATERLVLDTLRQSDLARGTLGRLLASEDFTYLSQVVASFRIYELHLGLAPLFLRDPVGVLLEQRNTWLAMLRLLREPNPRDEKLRELRRVFRQLRRLAYLSLDLEHAELPIRMDVPALEKQLSGRVTELLREERGPLASLLAHLNTYVRPELYLAPDVVKAHAVLQQAGRALVLDGLATADPEVMDKSLRSMRRASFWDPLMQGDRPRGYFDFRHLHRVTITRSGESAADDATFARVPLLEAEMQLRQDSRCLLHAATGADGRELFLDLFVPATLTPDELGLSLCSLCRIVLASKAEDPRPVSPAIVAGQAVYGAAKAIMEAVLPAEFRFAAKAESTADDFADFILLAKAGKGADGTDDPALIEQMNRQVHRLGGSNDAPLRHEVNVLRDAMAGHQGSWKFRLVMLRGFEVLRRCADSAPAAELDGAYIDVRPSGAHLRLVEAKSGRETHEEANATALGDLKMKLQGDRLNWRHEGTGKEFHGGAEVSVALSLPMRPAVG